MGRLICIEKTDQFQKTAIYTPEYKVLHDFVVRTIPSQLDKILRFIGKTVDHLRFLLLVMNAPFRKRWEIVKEIPLNFILNYDTLKYVKVEVMVREPLSPRLQS